MSGISARCPSVLAYLPTCFSEVAHAFWGDMVLWDNCRAMHCTTGTKPGVLRVINRTTIEGDRMLGQVLSGE